MINKSLLIEKINENNHRSKLNKINLYANQQTGILIIISRIGSRRELLPRINFFILVLAPGAPRGMQNENCQNKS